MHIDDDKALDQVIDRFAGLIKRIDERQSRLEARIAMLYQLVFGTVVVLVAAFSFLTIILSRQLPDATAAVTLLNEKFASVADNMVRMERSVRVIDGGMDAFPRIIGHVDGIHGDIAFMSQDVAQITGSISDIDGSVGAMTVSVTDMRQSLALMEQNVFRMGEDVNHMSQPMRMFNWMNPFR